MNNSKSGGENIWQCGECDINFRGSSPAMEAEGAEILWRRSLELHNIQYKWMVSDGDSKAFNTVENVYKGCKVGFRVKKRAYFLIPTEGCSFKEIEGIRTTLNPNNINAL